MSGKTIGGFFPLFSGLSLKRYRQEIGGLFLKSGRACLAYILNEVRPSRIHLPFYLCTEIHDLVADRNLEVAYYPIDRALEPGLSQTMNSGDIYYVVNYFGLKNQLIHNLASALGSKLIVDNTHALFSEPELGCWTFSNVRKSLGLPDGAILNGPSFLTDRRLANSDFHFSHNVMRWFGPSEMALRTFRANERKLDGAPSKGSSFSKTLILNVNFDRISRRRISNFFTLQESLGDLNVLRLELNDGVPFCFPLLLNGHIERDKLSALGLFIPQYWTGLSDIPGIPEWELSLAGNLLPLPIDHRYNRDDMLRMATKIRGILGA